MQPDDNRLNQDYDHHAYGSASAPQTLLQPTAVAEPPPVPEAVALEPVPGPELKPEPVAVVPEPATPAAAPARVPVPPQALALEEAVDPEPDTGEAGPPDTDFSQRGRVTPFRYNKLAFLVTGAALLFIAVIGIGSFLLITRDNTRSSQPLKVADYPLSSLSVAPATGYRQLEIGESNQLTINGLLRVNQTLVLSPTDAPANPVAGQIYYDKTANAPYYFNGVEFVALSGNTQVVNNFQGQTGAVTLASGPGIIINGTTISNDGVLSLHGTDNQIIVSGTTGNLTLLLPQDIAVVSAPTFSGLTVGAGGTTTGLLKLANAANGNQATIQSAALGQATTYNLPDPGVGSVDICLSSGNCTGGSPITGSGTAGHLAKFDAPGNITDSNLTEAGSALTYTGTATITAGLTVNGGGANVTGNSLFKPTVNSTTAFQIQNAAGTSNLFVADTTNTRVGIGTAGPGYRLDVQGGDINTSGIYRVNGAQISSANLSNDSNLAKLNAANVFSAGNTFSSTVAIQGANSLSLGTASNLGSISFRDGASANTGTLQLGGALAGSVTYNLPVTTGSQTICTVELGNCAGSGSGITGTGTINRLAKFTASQTVADSSITDDGSTVTVSVGQVIQGAAGLTIGTSGVNGQLVFTNSSNTNTLTLQSGAMTGNLVLTLPTGDGANGNCLKTNGSGVLAFASCTGGAGGGVTSVNTLTGVLNVVGTANQVNVGSAGDTITLSLPQDINTAANVAFRTISLTGTDPADNLIVANALSGATGKLLDLKVNNVSRFTVDASGNANTTGQYQVNGSQISSANLSNDGNLAKLDGTGPQTFTGDNRFNGTFLARNASNSTAAFQIQNAAGTSNLFVADTTNSRIGIGTAAPGYTLDSNGDVNTTGVYRINGSTVCSSSGCTPASGSGHYIQNGTTPQTADFNITGNGTIGATLNVVTALQTNGTTRIDNAGNLVNIGSITATGGSLTTAGVLTLAGNQTADITTAAASLATALTIKPGASSGASNGAATTVQGGDNSFLDPGSNTYAGVLTLKGGDHSGNGTVVQAAYAGDVVVQGGNATGSSGNSRNGGDVFIDGGTGANTNGSITIGGTNSNSVAIGNATAATTVTIQGGTGASAVRLLVGSGGTLGLGNSGVASTVQIGNTTGAVTQTINIGNNATGSSTTNVTVGSTVAGTTTLQNATAIALNAPAITTNAATVALLNTTATTINFGGAASSAINIGPASNVATSINIAGGSGDTGCTVAGATGNLTCSGAIATTATTGTQGWWSRSGTTLQPATSGDNITTTGNISTTGSGTITSAGTLTASGVIENGLYINNGGQALNSTILAARATGNANNRLTVSNSGIFQWGDGTAAVDTSLSRSGVNSLQTGGNFAALSAVVAGSGASTQVQLTSVAGQAGLYFGSASDTNLYRNNAANTLKTDGSLTVSGDFQYGNSYNRALTRTLPTIVNNAVDIGSFAFTNGAGSLLIEVTVPSASFSVTKQYNVPIYYNATAGSWTIANPISDTGPYVGQDFTLDVNVNGGTASLRLRRTVGSTAGTANISITNQGVVTDAFTPSTAVTSVSTPTAYYSASVLTQSAGSVGIGMQPTSGAGLIQLASGATAATGITFANDTNLYRGGTNILQTDDMFSAPYMVTALGTANQILYGLTAGFAQGPQITFGSSGDTNLYRNGAGVLKTDGQFLTGAVIGAKVASPDNSFAIDAGGSIRLQGGTHSINFNNGSAEVAGIAVGAGAAPNITINGNLIVATNGNITANNALIQAGATIAGGATSINASSNFNTNINTGTSTGAVAIGNTSTSSTTSIQGGTGGSAVNISTGSGGTLSVGNGGLAGTVQIGNTTGAVAQTISIGNNATLSSSTTINFGSAIGTSPINMLAGTSGLTFSPTGGSSNIGIKILPGNDTTAALQVQNAAGTTTLINADTTNLVVTIAGNTTTFGSLTLTNAHFKSTQTTKPTIGTPSGCGTSPSAAVTNNSTDSAGQITITSGSGSVGGSCNTVVSFNKSYAAAPKSVMLTDAHGFTVGSYVGGTATGNFTVNLRGFGSAIPTSTTYTIYYWVIE